MLPLDPLREHGVEDALADADVSADALLSEDAPTDQAVHGLARDVCVELDVPHVEQQVGSCGLGGGDAREPLVVSLVLWGEAILSVGGLVLPRESEGVSLVGHGRLRQSGGLSWTHGVCRGLVRPRLRRL